MKKIDFNLTTNTARWYKLFWALDDWKMPVTTCKYYVGVISSVILIPFTFIGILFDLILGQRSSPFTKFMMTLIPTVIPYVFGLVILAGKGVHSFWYYYGQGWLLLLCMLVCMGVIGLLVWGGVTLSERRDRRRENKEKKPTIVALYIKQVKEKTCSEINWIKGEEIV